MAIPLCDMHGLHPTEEKIKPIKEAPSSRNVAELRSFVGMTSYYSKFLPQLSPQLKPLYDLLHNTKC